MSKVFGCTITIIMLVFTHAHLFCCVNLHVCASHTVTHTAGFCHVMLFLI